MHTVPLPDGIMEQHDFNPIYANLFVLLNRYEVCVRQLLLVTKHLIMVAQDQMLVSRQLPQDIPSSLSIMEAKITQTIHCVVGLDLGSPSMDHQLVHFRHVLITGASHRAEVLYVLVPKMVIRSKPHLP